jgi:hypothetical protein
VFTQVDDLVFVNLDWLTNRNHQFEGVNEYLYTISGYKHCRLVFLIRDGVNPRFTGMTEIIKQTISDLELTAETCFVYGYMDLDIANTTWVPCNAVSMWSSLIYPIIQDLPLANNEFEKHFAGMYGRADLFRLKLYKHLSKRYADQSVLCFNSNSIQYNHRFLKQFADDQAWFDLRGGCVIDYESGYGSVSFQSAMRDIHRHYQTYFLEVVSETDVHSNRFFTEKTVKNFYLGKPFLLMSGQHSLAYLHSLGFRTFSPWIDESYDSLSNCGDRIAAILTEINRIGRLSIPELQRYQAEMDGIFRHNRQRFVQISLGK